MKDPFNNAVGPQVRGSAPKAGKLIPALVVVSLAAGLQSATQFFAHDFGYQAALGRHFEHLYVPCRSCNGLASGTGSTRRRSCAPAASA